MQEEPNQTTDVLPKTQTAARSVQDRFLTSLCRERIYVCIYLVGGIKLAGYVKAFDQYCLYLDEPIPQIVYKHSICSILPTDPAKVTTGIDNPRIRYRSSTPSTNIAT